MVSDWLGGRAKVALGATLLGSVAVAIALSERKRRNWRPAESSSVQEDRGSQHAAEVRKEALDRQKASEEQEISSGGCSRNQGPLSGWQDKLHRSALAVNETLLALRGGLPSTRTELREIVRHIATAETTLQDALYCTGKEAQIAWLMEELALVTGSDASTRLLDPIKGETLRQDLIYALQYWDEQEL